MTANAFAEDRSAAIEAGMNDHLSKPVDPYLMAQILATWLPHAVDSTAETQAHTQDARVYAHSDDEVQKICQQLNQIPGFDLSAGLRSLNGDAPRLLDLLRRFRSEHSQDAVCLNQWLEQGQMRDAERSLHTLKGLAGTLGFLKLQEYAAAAEHSLRYHVEVAQLKGQLVSLEFELNMVVQALHRLLPDPQFKPIVDLASLSAQLDQLCQLLAQDDLDASEFYSRMQASVASHYPQQVKRLSAAIDQFSFKEALAIIQTEIRQSS